MFGVWDTAIIVLLAFMVLDYATGLIKAYVNKEISSDVGLKGIARKSLILISLLENCAQLGLPIPDKLREALIQLQSGNKKGIKESEKDE
ncbi:phage holin family protein [Clostridium sp. CF012]|nr:phage holin family protein [Clostridium sp. CF012]